MLFPERVYSEFMFQARSFPLWDYKETKREITEPIHPGCYRLTILPVTDWILIYCTLYLTHMEKEQSCGHILH